MGDSQTARSAARRRRSEMDSGPQSSSGRIGRRHSTVDLLVENGALLEVNKMELRSGRNLVKYSDESSELKAAETSILVENVQTPKRKSSQTNRSRRKSMEFSNELPPAETSIFVENAHTPKRKSSQTKKNRRKSMEFSNELKGTACASVENTRDTKSSQLQMNKRKSNWVEENELEFSDLTLASQESEVSSTHMIQNVERNDDLSLPISGQNKDDIAEILNSTFEVAEEDSVLQTPYRKRSVRFAAAVETRRRTASLSSSTNNTPKCSAPVSLNRAQRSSEHKGTPHPSAKKRLASILKASSSKKLPSSSKDKSLSGRCSARKMPDFSSIHKAQFEKMESIDDFSRRRRKCARKLEAQACEAVGDSKQAQPKLTAVINPVEQTIGNVLSRIPMAQQNIRKPGTPRSSSSSHIPIASFRVLTEKNFEARRSTPYKFTSKPSFTKIGNNSMPKPANNPKPQRITYEQVKATIQNKKPLVAVKREAAKVENRNLLKGVRLNRRFELQMQHRKLNL